MIALSAHMQAKCNRFQADGLRSWSSPISHFVRIIRNSVIILGTISRGSSPECLAYQDSIAMRCSQWQRRCLYYVQISDGFSRDLHSIFEWDDGSNNWLELSCFNEVCDDLKLLTIRFDNCCNVLPLGPFLTCLYSFLHRLGEPVKYPIFSSAPCVGRITDLHARAVSMLRHL